MGVWRGVEEVIYRRKSGRTLLEGILENVELTGANGRGYVGYVKGESKSD